MIDVTYLVDMPYGGVNYKAGESGEIEDKFVKALVALGKVEVSGAKVVKDEPASEDMTKTHGAKSNKGKYKTKDMKAE